MKRKKIYDQQTPPHSVSRAWKQLSHSGREDLPSKNLEVNLCERKRGAGEGLEVGGGVKHSARAVIGSPPISNGNLTLPASRSGEEGGGKEPRHAVSGRCRSEVGAFWGGWAVGVRGVGWRKVKRVTDKRGREMMRNGTRGSEIKDDGTLSRFNSSESPRSPRTTGGTGRGGRRPFEKPLKHG